MSICMYTHPNDVYVDRKALRQIYQNDLPVVTLQHVFLICKLNKLNSEKNTEFTLQYNLFVDKLRKEQQNMTLTFPERFRLN